MLAFMEQCFLQVFGAGWGVGVFLGLKQSEARKFLQASNQAGVLLQWNLSFKM